MSMEKPVEKTAETGGTPAADAPPELVSPLDYFLGKVPFEPTLLQTIKEGKPIGRETLDSVFGEYVKKQAQTTVNGLIDAQAARVYESVTDVMAKQFPEIARTELVGKKFAEQIALVKAQYESKVKEITMKDASEAQRSEMERKDSALKEAERKLLQIRDTDIPNLQKSFGAQQTALALTKSVENEFAKIGEKLKVDPELIMGKVVAELQDRYRFEYDPARNKLTILDPSNNDLPVPDDKTLTQMVIDICVKYKAINNSNADEAGRTVIKTDGNAGKSKNDTKVHPAFAKQRQEDAAVRNR